MTETDPNGLKALANMSVYNEYPPRIWVYQLDAFDREALAIASYPVKEERYADFIAVDKDGETALMAVNLGFMCEHVCSNLNDWAIRSRREHEMLDARIKMLKATWESGKVAK